MKPIHFARLSEVKAQKRASHRVLFYRDDSLSQWVGITWQEVHNKVQITAQAMAAIGIKEQSRVAVCAQNMAQDLIVDMANYSNRGITVPMYPTLSPSQIEYIVNDAEISLMFVGEQLQYDNALKVLQTSKFLKRIVVFDQGVDLQGEPAASYFSDFMKMGEENANLASDVKKRRKAATEDDLAILMYTSGTTGEPKGVMLAHSNALEAMRIHMERIPVQKREKTIAFLPLSHIFERMWTYYCLTNELKIYLNRVPGDIQRTLREVHPHYMCSVPRFWEKVAVGVEERIESFSPLKKGMVAWATAIGRDYNINHIRLGKRPSLGLSFRYTLASKTIFSVLQKTIGIENAKVLPTAGAAMSDRLIGFFRSLGIPIVYGYGLTESTATVSCFPLSTSYTIGSVGDIMPDVQVKIGEDNEILLKGKTIALGYYNKPEATAAAFVDGWFHTGDAGRIEEGKILYMTDRIKDLFKTSNGKYISPQHIETLIGADRYIDQIAVIGDNRNYVTAIIAPAKEALLSFAEEQGITFERYEDLLVNPLVIKLYEERILKHEDTLAKYEQIKKFRLIKQSFSIASGELTSTLKLRRAVIQQNYSLLIDEMYEGAAPSVL